MQRLNLAKCTVWGRSSYTTPMGTLQYQGRDSVSGNDGLHSFRLWGTLTHGTKATRSLVLFQLIVLHDLLASQSCVHTQKASHSFRHLFKRQVADALVHLAPAHGTLLNLLYTRPAHKGNAIIARQGQGVAKQKREFKGN